jgi:hypothetical protein
MRHDHQGQRSCLSLACHCELSPRISFSAKDTKPCSGRIAAPEGSVKATTTKENILQMGVFVNVVPMGLRYRLLLLC